MSHILDLIDRIRAVGLFNKSSLLLFTITAGVLIIDLLSVGWTQSSLRKLFAFSSSTRIDFIFFVFKITKFYYLFEILFSVGVAYAISHNSFIPKLKPLSFSTEMEILMVTVFFIFTDLLRYLYHMIFHKIEALWELHSYHHSATEMNVLTFFRHHFLESTVSKLINILPLWIMGFNVFGILGIWIFVYFIELLQHSSIKADWGILGKYVLVSPSFHRVHHSVDKLHYDKNFGQIFVFWDKLFKTYQKPINEEFEIGLDNSFYNKKGFLFENIAITSNFIIKLIKPWAKSLK